jgi:ubiquinone/menaquinone biosynthesis C-methylase UbiE/uncharacterized protein YbaR (Trm112 family)
LKITSFDIICCPSCKTLLSLSAGGESEKVISGTLRCRQCSLNYSVEDGIPRFIKTAGLRGLNKGMARAYDRISLLYDSVPARAYLRRRFWPSYGETEARREVAAQLEIGDNSRVLETSIGTGDNAAFLTERSAGTELFGTDISIGMLKQCTKREPHAEVFLANAEQLPFLDESFEAVFHVGGINFFTDRAKAMAEMVRVGRAGSLIVIACETERAIQLNRHAIRLAFGKDLGGRMLEFSRRDILDSVPADVHDVVFSEIWEGNGYLLKFRKPAQRVLAIADTI